MPTIWSIGHSNHSFDHLRGLLEGAAIATVADVRSIPFSRWHPQFNRDRLRDALGAAGIGYVLLGEELGGRPLEPTLYDGAGQVRYDLVAATDRFRAGVERLVQLAGTARVAMMCSEEDPTRCHRRRLVMPALAERGAGTVHLRGDGSQMTEADLAASGPGRRPRRPQLFPTGD